MRTHSIKCAVAAAAVVSVMFGSPRPASAQSLSLQVGIGPGTASTSSDEYRNDGSGATFDALGALRILPLGDGALMMAAGASTHGTFSRTADCLLAPDGGCVPWYPDFSAISLLIGWGSRRDQVRVLTGPALVTADSRVPGWQARLELATQRVWALSAILSGRALVVPDYEGESYQMFAIAIGLRVSAF